MPINTERISRQSAKRKNEVVYVDFEVVELVANVNSGAHGFCQKAHYSVDSANNKIDIVTSRNQKMRGRKVYMANPGEKKDDFILRVKKITKTI